MVFKTVDINDALARMAVPAITAPVAVDGEATSAEWGKSLLCTSLYEYKQANGYLSNCNSDVQTRFRFAHDKKNLFCLVDFQAAGTSDIAKIYLAKDNENEPKVLVANLQEGKVALEGQDDAAIKAKVNGTKMEIQIPLETLGLKDQPSFLANIYRQQDEKKTYWRGNEVSIDDPVVYAKFILQ